MTKAKRLIQFAAFIAVFIGLLITVTNVLEHGDNVNIGIVRGFHETEKNTLDAVYIGSSNSFAFWNPMLAWEQYGICVQPFATYQNPFCNTKDFIIDARKRQPDALYIVNLNTFNQINNEVIFRAVIDSFPFSSDKLRIIWNMSDFAGLSLEKRLEYYFSIIRYHTRWNELTASDFQNAVKPRYKGAYTHMDYLSSITDLSDTYAVTSETRTLLANELNSLNELLDYCDRECLNILFVIVPQNRSSDVLERLNTVKALIGERGYPVLDLMRQTNEISLDLSADFYNNEHTNIHGSAKFTCYLSEYLINHYNFDDKRGQAAYHSWDEELTNYSKVIAPYLLDIEHIPHANTAKTSVTEVNVSRTADSMTVSWQAAEKANGYLVYRKDKEKSAWTMIADTNELLQIDPVGKDANPIYTVVPYMDGEIREYGSFIRTGVQAQ